MAADRSTYKNLSARGPVPGTGFKSILWQPDPGTVCEVLRCSGGFGSHW